MGNTDHTIPSPLYKVGEKVLIVKPGWGCHPSTIGKTVTITEIVMYTTTGWTYKIDNIELDTNTKTNYSGGQIWEQSFAPIYDYSTNKKTKMAKIKTITKNKAQEIRTIDTSLINKEEVFKMLALAESTGLPCLLVGQPGK